MSAQDTPISLNDLMDLRILYEQEHHNSLLNLSGSFYQNQSPLYTVLRRIFIREMLWEPKRFLIPSTLGELKHALETWHCPLDQSINAANCIKPAAHTAGCDVMDLPNCMISHTGTTEDYSKLDLITQLEKIFGNHPGPYVYSGNTSDASILAHWRMRMYDRGG